MSSSTPKTTNKISLRFIRDTNDSNRDDILSISPTEDFNIMEMKFEDKHGNFISKTRITESDLRNYFTAVLPLLKYDADPYKSVQFFFPQFPSVLINTPDLSDYLNSNVMKMVEMTYNGWYFDHEDFSDEREDEPSHSCQCKY